MAFSAETYPSPSDRAPWEMLKEDGSEESWKELLEKHPEFEKYAPAQKD